MADHAGSSPKLFRALIVLIALLVFGGIALRQTAPKPETVAAAGERAAATLVRTLAVVATPVRDRAVLSGVIEAKRRVRISSETNGRVLGIGAEELDAVEPDQLLVQVDPLQARVAVERGEAAVTRARGNERTTVIVIDTDPAAATAAGGHWWDVAVPQVSPRREVAQALGESQAARASQRLGD